MDFKAIEEKWQKRYEEAKLFEPSVEPGRPKFFVNFPYPYMNGYFHIGRAFSGIRAEVLTRYKLMQGYNALFPFAFHCTGTPDRGGGRAHRRGRKEADGHPEEDGHPRRARSPSSPTPSTGPSIFSGADKNGPDADRRRSRLVPVLHHHLAEPVL